MKYRLIAIAFLGAILSSCSFFATAETVETTTPSITAPIETLPPSTAPQTAIPTSELSAPDTTLEAQEPGEGLDRENIDLDLTLVDRTDPDAVALAAGCSFYAKPTRADTNTDLADRLRPLITDELHTAITTLRPAGDDIATVIPAIADEVRFQFYEVSCNRSVTGINGIPRLEGAFVDLRVEEQVDGTFLVSEMTVGALTIPASA